MVKIRLSGVMALSSLILLSFMTSSCVNEEYDMSEENLNLEVTTFEEGLILPLGSTEQIKLKELLKDVDADILGVGENGAYSISFNDSFDMDEQLSSLTDLIEIPDVDFSQKVSFQMNDVDVSDVRVKAADYAFDYEISSSVEVPEVTVPSVSEKFEVAAGMGAYVPDASELELDFEPISSESRFMSVSDDLHIPENQINDIPVPVEGDLLGDALETFSEFDLHETVPLKISLPAGISSVDEIVLQEGAAMKVTMALKGNFLHSGKLIPEIDVDLHNIFHLDASYGGDVAHLADDFVLSEENGYSQSKTYGISSMAVTAGDWVMSDGALVLDKTFEIPATGEIIFEDLMTTTRHIENDKNISVLFEVEFVDLVIDDIVMGIDPINISQENSVAISLDNVQVPEEIKSVRDVVFTQESGLDIVVKAQNLEKMKGLDAELETLAITFPEELSVEGADADNKIIVSDVDLAEGITKHIRINAVDLPEPVDGKISFSKDIDVKAVAKAGGNIHSADLSSDASDDVKVVVEVESSLEVADYNVQMAGYEEQLDIDPEVIKVEIPEEITGLEEIVIYPEGNPVVTVMFDIPELPLDLTPSAEGLCISFPDVLRFGELPSSYNYDLATNSITLLGSFPTEMEFPIEKLVLVPVLDPADGKYYAQGEVSVTGGVTLTSGLISKTQIEELTAPGKKISVVAHVPEIVPSSLALDSFETSIREEVEIDLISAEDIPAELVALGVVELENTFINLSLDASTLPDLGDASLSIDLSVDVPDMIQVAGADESGNLRLSGELDDKGMVVIDPIEVKALDLTGKNLNEGIKDVLVVDGSIRLSDASIDVDEWLGKDLEIGFNAGIKDIDIAKVTGKVDYQVDPVVESVDLSDFSAVFEDMGAEAKFDFYHAHLALEVETNLGVPVEAAVELVPYYDGKPDTGKIVPAVLRLEASESADNVKKSKFWLANSEDRMPDGYTFVNVDILGLLRDIPEKIEFRLNAGTDPERECVLEPSADYTLKANYLFELPLEFGEEFEITYKTVIPDLPEILGTLLSKGNKVKLAGEIENSLPLALDLSMNILDSNGNVVPLAEGCGVQKIAPCNLDASASKTELGIVIALKDGVSVPDITSLELVFNANAAGVAGIPVTEDAYLQAVLQLVLPEGITVDLGEIMNN